MRFRRMAPIVTAAVLAAVAGHAIATPATNVFTYQGELRDAGSFATGLYDFRFRLFDGPTGLATPLSGFSTHFSVQVSNGLFTIPDVNFNATTMALNEAWLQVDVRPSGFVAFVPLGTRQPLTATPIASALRGVPSVVAGLDGGAWIETYRGNTRTSVLGTSNVDGGLFFFANDGTGLQTIEFDADIDDLDNGVAQAQIRVGSSGAGAGGGHFSAENNDGVATINLLGGASGFGGSMEVTNAASIPVIDINGENAHGGQILTRAENGFTQAVIEPDFDGEGAFMQLKRTDTLSGLLYNGNYAASTNPLFQILGSSSSATINLNNTGNGSVMFPSDAIYDAEILDEPGLATATEGFSFVTADGGYDVLLARTITCPTSGYVLVMGVAQPQIPHVSGTQDAVSVGVSDISTGFGANQDVSVVLPSALVSGTYSFGLSPQGVFNVSAGANTFYLLANKILGANVNVYDMQLTCVFMPTAYGTIEEPRLDPNAPSDDFAPGKPPLTTLEMQAERIASIQAAQQTRARELDAMQRQLAELQAAIDAELERQATMNRADRPRPVNGDPTEGVVEPLASSSR